LSSSRAGSTVDDVLCEPTVTEFYPVSESRLCGDLLNVAPARPATVGETSEGEKRATVART